MPVNVSFNLTDFLRFRPEIILTIAGTLLMVLDPLLQKRHSNACRAHFHCGAGRRDRWRPSPPMAIPVRRSAAC